MFLLSVMYLLIESIFNAQLVSVAGGKDSTLDHIRSVELFGRTISGIGATLLLADFLLKGKILRYRALTFIALGLLVSVVWPTVFFGQKWLVDHFIIEPSTAQDRQHAYYAQVLRSALVRNAVEIDGVPYDADQTNGPAEMTFLSIFSGLVYADEQIMAWVEDNQTELAEKYVRTVAYQNFDHHYDRYTTLRGELRTAFQEYLKASEEYNRVIDEIPKQCAEYHRRIENDVQKGWQSYQDGVAKFDRQLATQAEMVAPGVVDYFKRRNRCRNQICRDRVKSYYDKEIHKLGLGYIPPDYWLIEEGRGDRVMREVVTGAITGGRSILNNLLEGQYRSNKKSYRYTGDVKHYERRLYPKMEPRFTAESGLPANLRTYSEFRSHPRTSALVRNAFAKEGLLLPEGWRINNRAALDLAVSKEIRTSLTESWNRKSGERGFSIEPNRSWIEFQTDQSIQSIIRNKMGQTFYVSPLLMDWNNRQFKEEVIDSNIDRERRRLLSEIGSKKRDFANGGVMAGKGRSALRAAIVPPVSMALSLFLVILTTLKLPMKALRLLSGAESGSIREESRDSEPKFRKFRGPVISAMMMMLIFLVPLTIARNDYTTTDSTVYYFFDAVNDSSSPLVGYTLNWVMNAQPVVQPIGTWLEGSIGLATLFERSQGVFALLDTVVFSDHETRSSGKPTVPAVSTDLVPLTIVSNADSANVRIMNIGPRYRPRILLPPGRYDIEVSAIGYIAKRRWVKLDHDTRQFKFALKKRSSFQIE